LKIEKLLIRITGITGFARMKQQERIRIVQAILGSIDVAQAYPELTLELKQELDWHSIGQSGLK
jgi:hypothetical protein